MWWKFLKKVKGIEFEDPPVTERNQLISCGEHLMEFARKNAEEEIATFWASEEGKRFASTNLIKGPSNLVGNPNP
jgi:hypothetical protein